MIDIRPYLNKQTLILGDVRSGKTKLTRQILKAFIREGYDSDVVVLDLAPEAFQGIGGKLRLPKVSPVRYLTASIHAPRLKAKDDAQMNRLAEENARMIENLFAKLEPERLSVVFVNDATLYLHAGDLSRFLSTIKPAATRIINAYSGVTFADSALTLREKKLVEKLCRLSDRVIQLT